MPGHIPLGDVDPRVRRMFQRFLASWAVDALRLRHAGLDRPHGRGPVRDERLRPGTTRVPTPYRRAA